MMADYISEEAVFPRPPPEEIRSKWKELFSDPLISPSRLKATALTKAGLGEAAADGGIVLRSVYWRLYHGLLPPPTSPNLFAESVTSSREGYNTLRRRYLIAPDGRWASDCTGSEDHHSSSSSSSSSVFLPNTAGGSTSKSDGWDPLSLDTSSPWKTWFTHVDLRSTISQDVDRTFPDIPYFQLSHVKKSLITSLFLFSVLNPDVGYRQGMHELLACCFLSVDRDSLNTNTRSSGEIEDEAMWVTLDRRYVEHDAFQLFQAVMRGAKEFYEWRAEGGPIVCHLPISSFFGPKNRSANAPQAPIITRCNNIHNSLIRRIDPQLWERLETEGVEAQIWAIRWLRLIFTREIPFPLAMRIWDGVFAEDPGLGILDFICVAMLLLIRNELIEADYPTLLTQLLHYPSPSPSYPFEPSLILSQALFLKNNISPAAGVEVVLQNQDILGVKVNRTPRVPAEQPPVRGGFANGGSGRSGSRGRAGMGGLAQGLFERAQAAGLDKAFMTTVADLRKNLPDSATAYSYLPNLPFSPGTPSRETGSFSTIPSSISALPNRSFPPPSASRPPIDTNPSVDSVQSLKDAELEMAELRLAMVGMGKAMSEWLAILRPSPDTDTDSQEETGEKENAWRGLERIKDGLLDAAGKETEEIVREWGWHEGLESSSISSRSNTPAPAPAAESSNHDIQSQQQTEVHVEKGQLDFEDTTPTLNQSTTMPAQLSFPSPTQPRTQMFNPARLSSSANKPNLTLSSRSTPTPSSGLPRTPISVPSGPESGPITASLPVRPHSATFTNVQPQSARPQTAELPKERETSGDPLAGLGVRSRDIGEGWKKDKEKRSNGNGVDPLLGVGMR
uniref:Rab-GAP TBC domain-containing protein n=1 Tax=Kwoniella bestiolae CBS 10118 TaxID=1296100 RepID=A0A1B9G9A0_9TREE|nr:hypothetical protein I302_02414 [Kwoniella bestiolae CBS 10118]OCF27571.1 hypothetical protein I302_02414 [Kwoniella bestiolae CBS 10118]